MRLVPVAACVLGLTACVGDDPSVSFCPEGTTAVVGGCLPLPNGAQDAGTATTAGPGPTTAPDAGIAAAFAGRWALEINALQTVSDPELGAATRTLRIVALLDLAEPNDGLDLCALEPAPFVDIETAFPGPTLQAATAIPPTDVVTEGEAFALDGWGFLLGWTSDAPRTATLPAEPTDPRIADGDNDDNPGVTLALSGAQAGELYVASRFLIRLEGRATSPTAVAGSHEVLHERTVLGASEATVTFRDPTFEQAGRPAENYFRMLRLTPIADCAAALLALD